MSRAGLIGSSSDRRTVSTFGNTTGEPWLLAGGEGVATVEPGSGADEAGIVRCGGGAGDAVDRAAAGVSVAGAGGAGRGSEAICAGGLRAGGRSSSSSWLTTCWTADALGDCGW